ncbi:alpha-hydroxy-acid oxidizing protein [Streptomyces sp. NPDC002589]|uniref:alpha-hydroxy-acid oxidizing protein n=1 Tax=Streptomyces sp. NPDC002589 TaxID=3154420 RepID=UPI003319CB43
MPRRSAATTSRRSTRRSSPNACCPPRRRGSERADSAARRAGDDAPPACLDDLAHQAAAQLPADVWDFIDGDSGQEPTLAHNRAALDGVRVISRILTDVSRPRTATRLLGVEARMPVAVAPMAYHSLVHPEGEPATAREVTRCPDSELESFVGLVGGVASGDGGVLGPASLRGKLAATSEELARSAAAVGATDDATPMFQSSIVSEVMREGARTQAQAAFGDALGDSTPMFPGGLVPTADGLRWAAPEG